MTMMLGCFVLAMDVVTESNDQRMVISIFILSGKGWRITKSKLALVEI